MQQQNPAIAADRGFEHYRKRPRRDEFLKTTEAIVPQGCTVLRHRAALHQNGQWAPTHWSGAITRTRHHHHLLFNAHRLGEALFVKVGQELQERAFKINKGTIVDATIIGAPSSTKNKDKARNPVMHQTRKGWQWDFGMKLHIGVDRPKGLARSVVVTAANSHDKHPVPLPLSQLLHGNEQRVYGA